MNFLDEESEGAEVLQCASGGGWTRLGLMEPCGITNKSDQLKTD